VKVRGLEAGVTLFDRLKQFKKKDLAFILAGLGTLFMAPLAEHFMMAPEGGDSALNAGFGGGKNGGGHGLFDNGGGSVGYDVSNGQAPGSAVGGGSDVITPLNVRDPSALVMGPGATQQPPTQSAAPSTPPPTAPVTRSDSDLKDALAASARGIGSAAHAAKALLPVPKIGLTGAGGLRGLGVANGGSSASASLGPISSAGLTSGKAAPGGGMAGVKGGKDIKGIARGQSSGASGLEALKAAAGSAGDQMNRGPAQTALDNTAAQAIPAGGSNFNGSGQGGAGANDKAESGNGGKDNKSTGESLEFLKQKALQEKKIELWAKEQEAGDNKLEMLKLRNSMAEAIAGKIGGAVGDAITCPMTKGFKKCWAPSAGVSTYYCSTPGSKTPVPYDASLVGDTPKDCTSGKDGQGAVSWYQTDGGNTLAPCPGNSAAAMSCTPDGATPTSKGGDTTGSDQGVNWATRNAAKKLGGTCDGAKALMGNDAFKNDSDVQGYLTKYTAQSKNAVTVRDGLTGDTQSGDCGAPGPGTATSVDGYLKAAIGKLTAKGKNSAIDDLMTGAVSVDKVDGAAGAWTERYNAAKADLAQAKQKMAQLDAPYQQVSGYIGSNEDTAKRPSGLISKGGSSNDFDGLRQMTTGPGGLTTVKSNLDKQIEALDAIFQKEGDKVADPSNGSLIGGIKINERLSKAVADYNKALAEAKTKKLVSDTVLELKPDLKDPKAKKEDKPADSGQQAASSYEATSKALDESMKTADTEIKKVEEAVKAFKAGPTDATAVKQEAVDPAKKPVLDMQQKETENLQQVSKDFKGVLPAAAGAPGQSGPAKTATTAADVTFVPPTN
jgi:hypothetical protein